ncbi:hypothetical protein [Scytonema millei]|uniref:Uncharacterized protein n=1 Tax=Scytonema millei VB511283 TaxID=1245923 RepID=A0A9X5E6V6_9CYAN|nr:hypothetical protein [Scytonema millei]NHC36307.1 hypothetical protein [Scytonema millei VB511283]
MRSEELGKGQWGKEDKGDKGELQSTHPRIQNLKFSYPSLLTPHSSLLTPNIYARTNFDPRSRDRSFGRRR